MSRAASRVTAYRPLDGAACGVWRVFHTAVTASTNADARAGCPGDVFTADEQTAGRGRLDHKWLSPPGANLLFSAVVDVRGTAPAEAATLPLVAGLAVADAAETLLFETTPADAPSAPETMRAAARTAALETTHAAARTAAPETTHAAAGTVALKWPNDVYVGGRKLAGILCERHDDGVIVGVGVNVNQRVFPADLAARATSLALIDGVERPPSAVLAAVLDALSARLALWRRGGFAAVQPLIVARDWLKGREVTVFQTDADAAPLRGRCGGIRPDGALDVGGLPVYAGEVRPLFSP